MWDGTLAGVEQQGIQIKVKTPEAKISLPPDVGLFHASRNWLSCHLHGSTTAMPIRVPPVRMLREKLSALSITTSLAVFYGSPVFNQHLAFLQTGQSLRGMKICSISERITTAA